MGKNHRHKKNLKADKAKIKLKLTKTQFLPKGLNETKATFKIKPIVLAEQLGERKGDVPLSKRKLNINDLCSRINHYNENVRCSACEELTEMYKHFYEQIIREYLGDVIRNVSNLMQDRERKVRNAVIKAITVILELTPSEKLEPFYKYFSVNLRCAMTNINENIQEDSLKFLDCFLLKNCGLISKHSDTLLPDFFTLISRLRSDGNLGRTLTLNLGSKMTSVSWRVKVLSRLHNILDLVLKHNEEKDEKKPDFVADSSNTFPIYKKRFFNVLDNSSQDNFKGNKTSNSSLGTHLLTLIPVFYDIWLEVVPNKNINKALNESVSLNLEAAAILCNIVSTMYLLWKYIEAAQTSKPDLKNIFASVEATKFLNHLVEKFPYSRSEGGLVRNRPGAKSDNNADLNCVKENIIICYILFVINDKFSRNTSKKEMECISSYINKCLLTKNYINENNIHYILDFLNLCLLEKCHVWKKSRVDARDILESAMVFYNNASIGEKNKTRMFKIFLGLFDNPYLSRSPCYQSWLSSLSELLCKPQISDTTVESLLELARKDCNPFLIAIRTNMSRILKNLDFLAIILSNSSYKDESIIKREIAFIFYYIKEFTCQEIRQLLDSFSNHISKQDCLVLKEQLHGCKSNFCLILN